MQNRPHHIDEYRIIRPVATGPRFTVYRATGREGDIALKVAANRSARDLAYLRREREVVRHLGLPPLRDVSPIHQSADGYAYIVMPWMEHSLREEMTERRRYSKEEVIKLLKPVAEALDEMHAQQYTHCDLTPEHILLGSDGQIALAGLAHARRRGQNPGKSDPRYASPEISNAQPVGPWCDIYSLGVIAYEMLIGRLPFTAETDEDWQRAHACLMPEVPRSVRRAIGVDASRALLRALAKEPADRFHSATAFVEALREEEPASMRLRQGLNDAVQMASQVSKRVPRFVKVLMLAAVTLATAAVLVVRGAQRPEPVPEDPRTATAAFIAALQTPDTIWTPRPLHSPSPTAVPTATTAVTPTTKAVPTATPNPAALTATVQAAAATSTPQPVVAPATLHPAPELLEPADVTHFAADGAVDLVWQYDIPLEPGESFDIRMWKEGEPAWGIARSTTTRYRLNGPPKGSGEYTWLIVVVRDDPNTGKVVETSHRSSTRRISWG